MTYYGRWTYKFEEGARKGAAAVFIVHETGPAGYPFAVVQGNLGEKFDIVTPDKNMRRANIEGWITLDAARLRGIAFASASFGKPELAWGPIVAWAEGETPLVVSASDGTAEGPGVARGRVLRRIAILGDDERHRLADVAHAIGGERPLQIALEAGKRGEPDGNRRGDGAEIGRGQHEDDARRSHRRRRVDAGKARVGDGAADDDGVTEIREHDVGDVAAAAREEPEILAAAHGRAHETPAGR